MSKTLDRISTPCCHSDDKVKHKSDHENSEDRVKSGFLKKAKNVSSKPRHSLRSKIKKRPDDEVCEIEDIREIEEQRIVDAFRQALVMDNLLPARFDDYHVMLRFLKARKFNIEKAKIMWANMLQSRENYGTDTIMEKRLYLASQSEFDHQRLLPYSRKHLEMNAAVATSGIHEMYFQAFRRWEIVEQSRDRYKKKYREAKRRSCANEAKKLKEGLEALKKDYAELTARHNERMADMTRLDEALKQSGCKVSTLEVQLKKAHSEAAAAYDRGVRQGENLGRFRLVQHFKEMIPAIERYGVRRFVEGPAFNKATEVKGIRDFDMGFDLAVAQIKIQGLIPVTFDTALIGPELPDPRPSTDAGAHAEVEMEVDWRHVEFGFVVEQMRVSIMDETYTGPLPEPVDLDREFGLDSGPSCPSAANVARGGLDAAPTLAPTPTSDPQSQVQAPQVEGGDVLDLSGVV